MSETMMTPQPDPVEVAERTKRPYIGLPAATTEAEKRFPLTPEAVAVLIESGYGVKIEENAARSIHYTDMQYIKAGAEITSRKEAFGCDIVIHLAATTAHEIKLMKRGAMLLSMFYAGTERLEATRELLRRSIIYIAIDLVADRNGNTPFADILSEIDGRAVIAISSSMLAGPEFGKGILLGGVSGIVPCEVTIIGSGIAACAAAASAIGVGATVRMFDNDIYRLRQARQTIGAGVVTSAMHPRVLLNALRTADIVVTTDIDSPLTINADDVEIMKKGVIIMELNKLRPRVFPSLPQVDLTTASPERKTKGRVCFTSVGNTVPRTAAMALSNTFISMLDDMLRCDGPANCVKLRSGVQKAVVTFFGKIVNHKVANSMCMRAIDIHILLNCS